MFPALSLKRPGARDSSFSSGSFLQTLKSGSHFGMRTVAITPKCHVAVVAKDLITLRKALLNEITVEIRPAADFEDFPVLITTTIDMVNRKKLQATFSATGADRAVCFYNSVAKISFMTTLCRFCPFLVGIVPSEAICIIPFAVCFLITAGIFLNMLRVRLFPSTLFLFYSFAVFLVPSSVGWPFGCLSHNRIILQEG